MRRRAFLGGVLALAANAAAGAPEVWRLAPGVTEVTFIYRLEGRPIRGQLPVSAATILLDFSTVSRSRLEVVLDATRLRGGIVFATAVLKRPAMFDVERHPTIRFVSTRIARSDGGATVTGEMTIKEITAPVRLDARFYSSAPVDPGTAQDMTLTLDGQIDRNVFGLSAFSGLVAPEVDIRIRARILRG